MADRQKNKVNRYGNIVTTIAIAVFLVLWTVIDRRLQSLEAHMRSLELQVTVISTRLGIDTETMLSSTHSGPPPYPDSAGAESPY